MSSSVNNNSITMANEDDTTKSSPSKPRLVRSNTFDLLCSSLNRDDDDDHTTSNTNLESQNPAKSTTNLTKSKTRTVKASQSTGEVGSPRKTSRAKSAKASSTLNHRIAFTFGNDNSSTANGTTSDYDNREARGFMFVNMSHLPAQEEPEVNSSSRQSESRTETGLIFYDLKPSSNVNSSKGKTRMLLDSNPLKQNGTTLSVAENSGDTLVFVVSDKRIAENREQLMASRIEDEDNEDQSSTSTSTTTTTGHRATRHSTRTPANDRRSDQMTTSWTSDVGRSVSQQSLRSRVRNPSPGFELDPEMVTSMSSSIIRPSIGSARRSSSRIRSGQEEDRLARTLEASSRLGQDLLRMFLKGINTDVAIQAEEKLIPAHKFILTSRSPYFSSLLKTTDHNKPIIIKMEGFRHEIVHFTLTHMYSGSIILPSELEKISEIAVIADLLKLESLIDSILHELKNTYCHNFHKPCKECMVGVVDVLILSSNCNLIDLKSFCLSWVGKNFSRIWPTRPFALLPSHLREESYVTVVSQLTPETAIEVILACERLSTSLPRVKWTEVIHPLVTKLSESTVEYIAGHYDTIVSHKAFTQLSRGRDWNISTIEESFISAASKTTVDIACRSIVQLYSLVEQSNVDTGLGSSFTESFVNLIKKLHRATERQLIQNANEAIKCQSWDLLSPNQKDHIKDAAVIVYEFDRLPPRPKPKVKKPPPQKPSQTKTETEKGAISSSESISRPSSSSSVKSGIPSRLPPPTPVNCPGSPKRKPLPPPPHTSSPLSSNSTAMSATISSATKAHSKTTSAPSSAKTSKVAVGKGLISSSTTVNKESSNNSKTSKKEHHNEPIYDEVPVEGSSPSPNPPSVSSNQGSQKKPVQTSNPLERVTSPSNPSKQSISSSTTKKSSQVVKVAPFNHSANSNSNAVCSSSPSSRSSTTNNNNALTDSQFNHLLGEIDAESSLVRHCLQEAELLEQELTKKLKTYQDNVLEHSKTPKENTKDNSKELAKDGKPKSPVVQAGCPSSPSRLPKTVSPGANSNSSNVLNPNGKSVQKKPSSSSGIPLSSRPPFR